MDIKIIKLTSNHADEYARFFDVTPHWDNMDAVPCYCVSWRSDKTYANGEAYWFPTREERRERAIGYIKSGDIQGYLAYYGDRVIGWCSANAECQIGLDHLRAYWPIDDYNADVKVKSVFCFMVAPDMQGMGVATKLLERVCEDAAAEGYDYVEAYANKTNAEHCFRGPLEMYLKCGFEICAERDGRVVVRKALKK
jgi:GNAT superfamily N-acetyltransferase